MSVFEKYINDINTIEDIDRIKTSDDDKAIIKDMPLLMTYKLQEKIDSINVGYIKEKYLDGVINKESADFLISQYSNTMDKHNLFYHVMMEMNDNKAYGIKLINTKTDKRTSIYHENSDPIANSDRFATPFLPIEVDLKNNHDNFTYMQFPGLKGVDRAVEKIMFDGKYDSQYNKECEELRVKYFYNYYDKFEKLINEYAIILPEFGNNIAYLLNSENSPKKEIPINKKYEKIMKIVNSIKDDEIRENIFANIDVLYNQCLESDEKYQEELSKILKPHERLNDIYRASKSEVCFEDIGKTFEKFEDAGIEIVKIYDNHSNQSPLDDQYKQDSYKGYRDYKLICKAKKEYIKIVDGKEVVEVVDVVFELQIKLLPYAKRDKETHRIYEEIRVLEDVVKKENSVSEREKINKDIKDKKNQIEKIYEDCILEYNAGIIEMASRMEITELRDKWLAIKSKTLYDSNSLEKYITSRNKERDLLDNNVFKKEKVSGRDDVYQLVSKKEGKETYKSQEVIDFLERNLIVSPKKSFSFNQMLHGVSEASKKRKTEKYIKESSKAAEKLLVKDDFRTSRGEDGAQNFMIRYYNEIRQVYIPQIRAQNSEDHYNYDKALESLDKNDKKNIDKQILEELDVAEDILKKLGKNNEKIINNALKFKEVRR